MMGSNLRLILLETGLAVVPSFTKSWTIKEHRVYKVDNSARWRLPLLRSLLEIRDQRWQILFDEEFGTGELSEDDITTVMIRDVYVT